MIRYKQHELFFSSFDLYLIFLTSLMDTSISHFNLMIVNPCNCIIVSTNVIHIDRMRYSQSDMMWWYSAHRIHIAGILLFRQTVNLHISLHEVILKWSSKIGERERETEREGRLVQVDVSRSAYLQWIEKNI